MPGVACTHCPLPSPHRFDWHAEVIRAKQLIAAGEADFELDELEATGAEEHNAEL